MGRHMRAAMVTAGACLVTGLAHAQIVVGVVLSLSGPAAPVGRVQQAVVAHLPARIGDETVRYMVRDDASDPARAVVVATEVLDAGADLILGTTSVAASRALVPLVAARGVPLISPAALPLREVGTGAPGHWAFRTAPDDWLMAAAIVAHLRDHGHRRVGFLGFDDSYGAHWATVFGALADVRGLDVVSQHRFHPGGDDLGAAVARILAAHPEAVMVAAAGSAAVDVVAALRGAGFSGPIYQTQAVAVAAFIDACAGRCDQVFVPASPARVVMQLPADSPLREAGMAYRDQLGARAGPFGAALWDAGRLFAQAAATALTRARPGEAAFRVALRDGLEQVRALAGANGVYSMSAGDHVGLDQRAGWMVRIVDGRWQRAD
ncbi:ABC transporter substrate-binding protein [Nitrogeniibacter mangrovi]|uniref:ABC transporter substrate-binding protein n=1 Tax=Nitrogeniibacter mangrovi TaxID=2016596 RepID=A0A6C1B755_9RHOO|nr:ABC transporter substrate-binding protein [Nitrogeniibacter mangrovi]QID19193.1 ABC transporter substrate-binding protein [Nitrogeniibacter mangrovi]